MDRTQTKLTNPRILFITGAILVFVLDRVTKSLVNAQIPFGTEVSLIDHVIGVTNVRNSGAAFGFAPAGATFFLVASVVVSIGLVVYVARNPISDWTSVVLGLILGGTLGNGFDRVTNGTVTDFINVHFWPVFNVADAAISTGVVLMIAGYLLRRSPTS
ncbi:MAG: signal peptidase II [Chloroflexi bacterium]|nr:MAG: signal peptidase II [Chloroflexota bacterium]TMG21717.1 MAG: signal peptidase II [Chloroflexota bacterium]TMG65283.1 MAG: signal peptidase II [Chloroflexota bacterium]